jgi:hypothetical protein
MKRIHLFCLLFLAIAIHADGQTLPVVPQQLPNYVPKVKKEPRQLASFLLYAPVGSFAKSHVAGIGLNYGVFHSRYRIYVFKKYIGFTANAGVDYYLGKKTEVADHDFNYGGYGYGYIQAGVVTGITKKTGMSLTAGPAMGLYKGNTEFGWNASMIVVWHISNSRFLIGPGITVKKQKETDALWAIAFRTSYSF